MSARTWWTRVQTLVASRWFRLVFGVALPLACFVPLGVHVLTVFALVICAALAWRVLRPPERATPWEAFVSGILFSSILPCGLGLYLLVPVALFMIQAGLFSATESLPPEALLGLAPLPATMVYAREWTPRFLRDGGTAALLLWAVGAITPFGTAWGTGAVTAAGVERSRRAILDPQVPLSAAVAGARRWSWATDWRPLAETYSRLAPWNRGGPRPAADSISPMARRAGRAFFSLTGEHPEVAMARWGYVD